MANHASNNAISRRWIPQGDALRSWYRTFRKIMDEKEAAPYHPVIQEFADLIETDAVVRMYITQMLEQIPEELQKEYPNPTTVDGLLRDLNAVLTVAPYYVPPGLGELTALVGTPFSAILIWSMGTPAGFAAYRNAKINGMFKKLLAAWTNFLDSPASRDVLNDGPFGWQSEQALKQLHMQDYIYDPNAKYWGFESWNAFFTREVKPGARPIKEHIVAACDSTVYRVKQGVDRTSQFWIKTQPYSLADMLDHDAWVDAFDGGDVWQAFLSPFNYHRWHSPVAGKVISAKVIEGLYFSQADSAGEDPTDQDHSEAFITHVQTRALFIIQSEEPDIGLVGVMPVGMVEISSCIITPKFRNASENYPVPVDKGEEIGYFQFGGSTHCVFFQKDTIDKFIATEDDEVQFGQTIAIPKS